MLKRYMNEFLQVFQINLIPDMLLTRDEKNLFRSLSRLSLYSYFLTNYCVS